MEFSLSFETTPQKVKAVIKDSLSEDKDNWQQCESYAKENGFENVDYLLEAMIYKIGAFNALVIIDEIPDELEIVLLSRLFPVEILTLQRYVTSEGERIYQFEPFLSDISDSSMVDEKGYSSKTSKTIDPAEIDTIVVPARDEGFEETFIGENCWYQN